MKNDISLIIKILVSDKTLYSLNLKLLIHLPQAPGCCSEILVS